MAAESQISGRGFMIAEMQADVEAARQLTYHAAPLRTRILLRRMKRSIAKTPLQKHKSLRFMVDM